MEESHSREAYSHSASQEIAPLFIESEGSLLCSQDPATGPYPVSDELLIYNLILIKVFYFSGQILLITKDKLSTLYTTFCCTSSYKGSNYGSCRVSTLKALTPRHIATYSFQYHCVATQNTVFRRKQP
jgi:hypothetical protein